MLLTHAWNQPLSRPIRAGDILKTTLATDAVIGAMMSPSQAGSAYVLLHHCMGQVGEQAGVWAYVEGGMGAVSDAIAASAVEAGVEISTNALVRHCVNVM